MFINFFDSLKIRTIFSFLVAVLLTIPLITSCEENNGTKNPGLLVYAAGFSTNSSGVMMAGYWKNGVWNELTPLDVTQHSAVNSIIVKGDDVYAGGYSRYGNDIWVPGYWKNGKWNWLIPLDAAKCSNVNAMVVSNGDVYAGGESTNMSNVTTPGYWKNDDWTGLTPIDAAYSSSVSSIVISGEDVYAAGGSVILAAPATIRKMPCIWKNGTWNLAAQLDPDEGAEIKSMAIYGKNIQACGLSYGDGFWTPVYWNNCFATALPVLKDGLGGGGIAFSIFLSGTDVYIGGTCMTGAYTALPGYWKNGEWNQLTPLDATRDARVLSIVVEGDTVYAGGYCENSSGVKVAGYWINGVWNPLSALDDNQSSQVNSLVVE